MLTEESVFLLAKHYHTEKFNDCFGMAVELASEELDNVLDETREYPPFVYYLILENMDNNPKYIGGKMWSRMTTEERTEAFNDTIENLKKIIS